MDADELIGQGDVAAEPDAEPRLEEERQRVLAGVASGTLNTVERRVAWILNNYPDVRNSDITLQLRYGAVSGTCSRQSPEWREYYACSGAHGP